MRCITSNSRRFLPTIRELYERISHNVALRHLQSRAATGERHDAQEVHSIAAQIVEKMRGLFHTIGRDHAVLAEPDPLAPDLTLPIPPARPTRNRSRRGGHRSSC